MQSQRCGFLQNHVIINAAFLENNIKPSGKDELLL